MPANSELCNVCGETLEPVATADVADAPEEEPEEVPVEEHIECASCGASLETGSTECFLCGEVIVAEDVPELEPDVAEPELEAEEHVECSNCGASIEADAQDCFLCGAVFEDADAAPEGPAEEIIEEEIIEEEVVEEWEAPPEEEYPDELPAFEEAPPEELPDGVEDMVEDIIEEEVPKLPEDEMYCPSCSSVINKENEKCTECWTDLSLYTKCESCNGSLPVDAEICPNCFAAVKLEEVFEEELLEDHVDTLMDLEIEEEEITQELEEEMAILEEADENARECLVCGAHFGSEDEEHCPICGVQFGMIIEEPPELERMWEGIDVLVKPTAYICPNCGETVVGLESTPRELNEQKWFYRGIITIFIGIFFTSFSVWLRGITMESQATGSHPPPFDVVVSLVGWFLVIFGFLFWYMSYRISLEIIECPQCSIEVTGDMMNCINCSHTLIEPEEPEEAEELIPEDADMEAFTEEILAAEELADEIIEDEGLDVYEEEYIEEITEEDDLEVIEEELGLDLDLEVEEVLDLEELEESPMEELEELLPDIEPEEEYIEEPLEEEPELDVDEAVLADPLTEEDLAAPFETDEPMEVEPEEPPVEEPTEEEPLPEPEPLAEEPEMPVEKEPEAEEEAPMEESTVEEVEPVAAAPMIEDEPAAEEDHDVCPSCGAIQDNGSEECFLCGESLVTVTEEIPPPSTEEIPAVEEPEPPVEDIEEVEPVEEPAPPEEEPAEEEQNECPSCGALQESGSDECFLCGESLIVPGEEELPPPPEEPVMEEPAPPEEKELPPPSEEEDDLGAELPTEHEERKKCPGCGISVGLEMTECPVCDTPFDESEIPVESEIEIPIIEAEPIETETEKVDVECPSCGATLEAGSTKCFLCGAEVASAEGLPDMDDSEEEKRECPSCGAIIDGSEIICPICDESLV